jgi:hypothetical protein
VSDVLVSPTAEVLTYEPIALELPSGDRYVSSPLVERVTRFLPLTSAETLLLDVSQSTDLRKYVAPIGFGLSCPRLSEEDLSQLKLVVRRLGLMTQTADRRLFPGVHDPAARVALYEQLWRELAIFGEAMGFTDVPHQKLREAIHYRGNMPIHTRSPANAGGPR